MIRIEFSNGEIKDFNNLNEAEHFSKANGLTFKRILKK